MREPTRAAETLVGVFPTPAAAKAAMAALEGAGVGASDTSLVQDVGRASRRAVAEGDERKVRWAGRRLARWAALGATSIRRGDGASSVPGARPDHPHRV